MPERTGESAIVGLFADADAFGAEMSTGADDVAPASFLLAPAATAEPESVPECLLP